MCRGIFGALCAVALTAVPAVASDTSPNPAVATFEVSGFVPVICRANLNSAIVPVTDGEAPLGTLNEFCNSPAGYEIFVESSSELDGAMLLVDGREVPLSGSRPALIVSSKGPAIAARDIRLASAGQGGSLNFRIVAR
jgi:hypothetical protein